MEVSLSDKVFSSFNFSQRDASGNSKLIGLPTRDTLRLIYETGEKKLLPDKTYNLHELKTLPAYEFHLVCSCLRDGYNDFDKLFLIHWAAFFSNNNALKFYLKAKCSVNIVNNDLETPLFIAIANNNLEAVWILYGYGARFDYVNKYDESPLMKGIRYSDENFIITLLRIIPMDLNYKNCLGESPLSYAITYKRRRIIKVLLDCSTPIDNNIIYYLIADFDFTIFNIFLPYFDVIDKMIIINLYKNNRSIWSEEAICRIKELGLL